MPGDGGGANEDADSLPPLRSPKHGTSRDSDSYEARGMSRSVSDSTLRQAASRASLHLPLPVTSLMLFKVVFSLWAVSFSPARTGISYLYRYMTVRNLLHWRLFNST
jgi:hypothetical protein